MLDDTSNECQWKIKHKSSLETMPGNSPCDHRNQAKDMLKAEEHKAIAQHFKKNYDVHCVTLGTDHRIYFSPTQTWAAAVQRQKGLKGYTVLNF